MCAKAFKSDVEIAAEAVKKPITEIAAGLGLTADELEPYGKYKAKITSEALKRLSANRDAKLILVTAISPTPAGEGKTTTTIGLGQAMTRIGKKAVIALREPSLGPVFGVKGGAAGGGYAQVVPMDEINLHFTGDFHAITSANNLLSAVLDNHLHQGNTLRIDPKRIVHRRCVDMNDRALRGARHRARPEGRRRRARGELYDHRGDGGHGHPLPRRFAVRPARTAGADDRCI